jgi:hypothetical protein
MTEAPSDESQQDAVVQTNLQTVSTTPLAITAFISDAYQILSQLTPKEVEQLSNTLKELRSQIQPAITEPSQSTITGNIAADTSTTTGNIVTGTGNIVSGSATLSGTGTVNVTGAITEALPQPQAKQLTELISTRNVNVIKMIYYLLSILRMMNVLPDEPIQDITQRIIEWAEQQLPTAEDN